MNRIEIPVDAVSVLLDDALGVLDASWACGLGLLPFKVILFAHQGLVCLAGGIDLFECSAS